MFSRVTVSCEILFLLLVVSITDNLTLYLQKGTNRIVVLFILYWSFNISDYFNNSTVINSRLYPEGRDASIIC